jgi:probable HAF family extracellular repeat protein
VSPVVPDPSLAKGGLSSDPTVTSTTPPSARRDTTLNVTVAGSGFDQGSRAVWALDGDTTFATTRVRSNSTTYVTAKQLVANITIAADATLDLYDVQVVTAGGRKGIGIELFAVTGEIIDLNAGDGSSAEAVNDKGQIVGAGGAGVGAFLWENGVLRQLGALPGMTSSRAEDINENGQVVGYSSNADGSLYRAFIWTAAAGMQPLAGSLAGCCTLARAINDQGVVIGEARLPGTGAHTVVWENGVMRDVQSFPSGSTFPWDLSNAGVGVGQWNTSDAAFSWTATGGMTVLAGLDGPGDIPIGVNDLGQVVGWYRKGTATVNTAFLWQNGTIRDLGTLGGPSSVGMAINNGGQVVGRSDIPSRGTQHVFRAFLWTNAAGMKDLGSLSGRQWAQANDLNEIGLVVGQTWLSSGQSRATLWRIR